MTTTTGQHIIHYTLQDHDKHVRMLHYPHGDRIENKQETIFYHCHRENYEQLEHGHFQCFMRYGQFPSALSLHAA